MPVLITEYTFFFFLYFLFLNNNRTIKYNCAEAVNFATIDWFKYGKKCVQRYREYKKGPCFSHEELLFTILKNESNITLAIQYFF